MDDNIVDLTKEINKAKSDKATSIEDRVLNCIITGKDCECMYCTYKNNAAQMVVDFLSMDMHNFENTSRAQFATYDAKGILFDAIRIIKKMETDRNDKGKE